MHGQNVDLALVNPIDNAIAANNDLPNAGAARSNARDQMLGFGVVMEMLGAEASPVLLKKGTDQFLPGIEDPSFRAFPFYVPLFEQRTLEKSSGADLDRWSCGATLYIRESAEDRAIVIASREPLGPIFQKLGGKPLGRGWEIPA